MKNSEPNSTEELELILQVAGSLIGRDIEPAKFLEWFQSSAPTLAPQFAAAMSDADGGCGSLVYLVGRALWNAMPQPSNRYRPKPLPKPNRNGRCPCGSGRKFKQCCAQLEPPSEMFESMNLLRYVLDNESMASLKRIDGRSMDPAALDDVARQWARDGNIERALALVEPLFDAAAKPPKHADILLDMMFDIWPPDYKRQRRRKLAERLVNDANPDVACVALHRCILMLSDEGKMNDAWERFHAGMRQHPDYVNFAGLEITLLLSENRVDDAKRRAEFWARSLRRRGSEFNAYADRLLSLAESREDHSELEQLRTMSPFIDLFAGLIESQPIQIDGYAPRPTDIEEPIVLEPTSKLAATERRWSEEVGGQKPALVMLDVDDELLDPADLVEMLERDPAYLHSFDVLDDICRSLDVLTDGWAELGVVLELVLQRAETMLLAIMTGSPPDKLVTTDTWRKAIPSLVQEVPWGFMENRPALRLISRHIQHLQSRTVASSARWLPRALALLCINPNDNHGYRELVSCEFLRQQHPADALMLLDKYPDDAFGAVFMNRVLALHGLDRYEEAAAALLERGIDAREMRKGITQERYAKPRDATDDGVILGSRHEAWLYRQGMRDAWKASGAIEWLKQQPMPRKSRARKAEPIEPDEEQTLGALALPPHEQVHGAASMAEHFGEPLTHQALRNRVDELAPQGNWLLGLTLAAALTPDGRSAVQRLIDPLLQRFGPDESVSDDIDDMQMFNTALNGFMTLHNHFTARLLAPNAFSLDTTVDDLPLDTAHDATLSADLITEDLSMMALDDTDIFMELVSGIVAGIDGNPRGWSSIPTGPRNNVIGPLRLMAASAHNAPEPLDTALANVSLFNSDDKSFQLGRQECLLKINELVVLANLSRR